MSRIVTTEEFTTRRKIRGTGPNAGGGAGSSTSSLRSKQYPLTPLSVNASLSPYKAYYEKDADAINHYYIDFNIGNFKFDEITIRTEGQHRLIVHGKSEPDEDDIGREFTRDFTLPKNVDQYSIKAQLEETTRILTLVGQVEDNASRRGTAANSLAGSAVTSQTNIRSMMNDSIVSEAASDLSTAYSTCSTATINGSTGELTRIGSIKETKLPEHIDYEIYLGEELKDGQVNLEMVGTSTLVVRVTSSDWDRSGDYNLELKRQIKTHANADLQHTQHGVDAASKILLIKVPFKTG